MSTIGQSLPRVDGAAKVTGVTRFAGDVYAAARSAAPTKQMAPFRRSR